MSAQPISKRQVPAVDRVQLAAQLGAAIAYWMPRSQQLVLGWLMVCTPAEQSQAEIREALNLSSGAVSNALRWMVEVGLVERVAPAGDRTARYLLPVGAWTRTLEGGIEMMAKSAAVIEESIDSLKAGGEDRVASNLSEFRDYYSLVIESNQRILEQMRSS